MHQSLLNLENAAQQQFSKTLSQLSANDVLKDPEGAQILMGKLRVFTSDPTSTEMLAEQRFADLFELLTLPVMARLMCHVRGFKQPNDHCYLYSRQQIEEFGQHFFKGHLFRAAMILARGENESLSLFHSFKVFFQFGKLNWMQFYTKPTKQTAE